jgi:ADP-heptose:LPS heptosyltransferase
MACTTWSISIALDAVPDDARPPYLFADQGKVQEWRQRIGTHGLRVGVCWRALGLDRRIPLRCFAPLADVPGVRLVSLQAGRTPEVKEVGFPVEQFADLADASFSVTAAMLANLDLVVTIDTAVAHLAGAMGVPVWTILPRWPDTRWRGSGSTTELYPSMRLFRPEREGKWDKPLLEVAAALAEMRAIGGRP